MLIVDINSIEFGLAFFLGSLLVGYLAYKQLRNFSAGEIEQLGHSFKSAAALEIVGQRTLFAVSICYILLFEILYTFFCIAPSVAYAVFSSDPILALFSQPTVGSRPEVAEQLRSSTAAPILIAIAFKTLTAYPGFASIERLFRSISHNVGGMPRRLIATIDQIKDFDFVNYQEDKFRSDSQIEEAQRNGETIFLISTYCGMDEDSAGDLQRLVTSVHLMNSWLLTDRSKSVWSDTTREKFRGCVEEFETSYQQYWNNFEDIVREFSGKDWFDDYVESRGKPASGADNSTLSAGIDASTGEQTAELAELHKRVEQARVEMRKAHFAHLHCLRKEVSALFDDLTSLLGLYFENERSPTVPEDMLFLCDYVDALESRQIRPARNLVFIWTSVVTIMAFILDFTFDKIEHWDVAASFGANMESDGPQAVSNSALYALGIFCALGIAAWIATSIRLSRKSLDKWTHFDGSIVRGPIGQYIAVYTLTVLFTILLYHFVMLFVGYMTWADKTTVFSEYMEYRLAANTVESFVGAWIACLMCIWLDLWGRNDRKGIREIWIHSAICSTTSGILFFFINLGFGDHPFVEALKAFLMTGVPTVLFLYSLTDYCDRESAAMADNHLDGEQIDAGAVGHQVANA